ncbi:MAG: dethiobiotin synthase [Rhodanobacteraceae bacterium]|nr:dethiobiotin synthase [Rhodanobacteraceae bacterium]
MKLFVSGTDTGIGKTYVTAGLVRALRAAGRDASAAKPVASGYELVDGLYRNADLDTLAAASGHCPGELCVYGFTPAIAPHRAAELSGVEIRLQPIVDAVERLAARHADLLVEGVGGFAVPLSPALMLADLVRALGLPVLLVVGVRLGCINHALLSADAIRAAGLPLAGWIANRIDPAMDEAQASIDAIAARIGAPLLGEVARDAGPAQFAPIAERLLREPAAPGGVHSRRPA